MPGRPLLRANLPDRSTVMKTLIIVIVVVAVLLVIAFALAVRIVKQYEQGCCSGWAGCGARGHQGSG
jgi:hypothetical protein